MPAVWLMVLGFPGVGVVLGAAVMYGLKQFLPMGWPLFIAGALGFNLIVDLFVVWAQQRVMPSPSAHTPVGRAGRVIAVTASDAARGRGVVDGVKWRVHSRAPLAPGQFFRVVAREGLTLRVEPEDEAGAERVTGGE